MAAFAKIIHINQEEIPQEMFNKTYDYFSFDIIANGHIEDWTPLWLTVAEDGFHGTCVALTDLDILNDDGKQRLIDFLKSITLNEKFLPFEYDIRLAKYKYGVDMKTVNELPRYEGIRI